LVLLASALIHASFIPIAGLSLEGIMTAFAALHFLLSAVGNITTSCTVARTLSSAVKTVVYVNTRSTVLLAVVKAINWTIHTAQASSAVAAIECSATAMLPESSEERRTNFVAVAIHLSLARVSL
jgi:hypothetical protein